MCTVPLPGIFAYDAAVLWGKGTSSSVKLDLPGGFWSFRVYQDEEKAPVTAPEL